MPFGAIFCLTVEATSCHVLARLRVVSNFGDGDCGAGKIHARARKFEETRREGSAEFRVASRLLELSRARVCILPASQSQSPKLETTRSLRTGFTLTDVASTVKQKIAPNGLQKLGKVAETQQTHNR